MFSADSDSASPGHLARGGLSLAVLILLVLLVSGCASTGLQTQANTAQANDAETASTTAALPEERPVDDERVFPPPPPEGVEGIAVPAVVTEPVATYESTTAFDGADQIFANDVPTPKRQEPRATVRMEVDRHSAEPEAQPNVDAANAADPANDLAPAADITFESLDFDDNSSNLGSLFIPPDASGAAGPEHVVSVTNVSIQFHTKSGTGLLDSTPGAPVTGISLASFFSAVSPVNATFDPKVLYDQMAERFVVVTLERQDVLFGDPADTSRILVAVSDDADPTGTWHMTAIDSKVSISAVDHWADYPGFSVDEEAVYITANMFSFFSSGGAPGGVRLWVIDKFTGAGGGLYGGGTATVSLFDPYGGGGFESTTQPAHIYGTASTTPNVGTFLVSYSGLTDGTDEFVQIVRIDDPIGPGGTAFTLQFLNIGDIEDFSPSALPDAPQSGSAETIETNDRRALDSVWRSDSLWFTATIDPTSGADAGQATAHWWELDTTTLALITLAQQGDVGGEDLASDTHTFFPSIAVNTAGDAAIGFSASASTIFPSSAYTTHESGGAAGSNTGSVIYGTGLAYYIRTFDSAPCSTPAAQNRWGDYSAMVLDPFDQCFWAYNQHALTRGTGTTGGCNGRPATEEGRWGTEFAHFCETCPTHLNLVSLSVTGTDSREASDNILASTVTVEMSGDLTLTSGEVSLDSGFGVHVGGVLSVVIGPCA